MDMSAYQHHVPMEASSHSRPPSALSSAHSSPHFHHQQPVYPEQSTNGYVFNQLDASLHIATGSAGPHDHEAGEETAHPLRPRPQTTLFEAMDTQSEAGPSQPSIVDAMTQGPGPNGGLSRPLTHQERELIAHLDRLKFFLATAPSRWNADGAGTGMGPVDPSALPVGHPSSMHPALNRFLLPNSEYVSCVLWGGLYHITGTDIVRALVFRFEAFGRPVKNMKKFEEGVFSDLRNLKPGVDACLEEPKSPFLDLLFKYQCIRTQKKQKVFYWFSVPHDRLFLDALERDLKREKMGLEPTTVVVGEPALSFTYDPKRSLYEQFSKAHGSVDDAEGSDGGSSHNAQASDAEASSSDERGSDRSASKAPARKLPMHGPSSPFFSMFSLFEGSPTYKQRRKKVNKVPRRSPSSLAQYPPESTYVDEYGRVQVMRPPEPHMDRFGRDTERLSAAEMFAAQARGDFTSQSNPDVIVGQKERQRRALDMLAGRQTRPLSYPNGYMGPQRAASLQPYPGSSPLHSSLAMQDMGVPGMNGMPAQQLYADQMQDRPRAPPEPRHTYPMAAVPPPHQRSHSQPYAGYPEGWPAGAMQEPPRSKAFVCPLFSCGRMFKRMEHLKRHLRTHTLERPYQCQYCQKRFSRSDNLNQHQRTHTRAGAGAGAGAGDGGGADADSEEVDELDGDEDGVDGALDFAAVAGIANNAQMYEVEVQGQVQEVHGDEEGLVMATGALNPAVGGAEAGQDAAYYPQTLAPALRGSPEQSPFMLATDSPQWAHARPHSSMSYTAEPVGGPHARMSPALGGGGGGGGGGEFGASVSAPANKASFDHAALYPAELDMGGPGPIRRHRSVTPNLARYGEPIRRPVSAAFSDHGAPQPPAARAYHPYAVAAAHPAHSANSSPLAYSVPLGYGAAQQQQQQRPQAFGGARVQAHSHSRSSSGGGQLQEQMQQMLTIDQMDYGMMMMDVGEGPQALPQFDMYAMAQAGQADAYGAHALDAQGMYSALGHGDAHAHPVAM